MASWVPSELGVQQKLVRSILEPWLSVRLLRRVLPLNMAMLLLCTVSLWVTASLMTLLLTMVQLGAGTLLDQTPGN